MRPVSIVGCGYTGLKLAQRWRERGAPVRGYATRDASLAAIAASGATPCRLDLDLDLDPTAIDTGGAIVYYAVPPAATTSSDARLERFLARLTAAPARIVYLSTTGVYGDHAGAVVDEDTPLDPRSARAARRVAAEGALRAWAAPRQASWCILRVAGIYGPGRLPLGRLRAGEPVIATAEAGPGNRIHVDDLVEACVAAGEAPQAHLRVYNVCDGTHDSMTEYLVRVARIAGLPAPPQLPRAEAARVLPESMWSFLAESRRVSNRRLVGELGVRLRHADLDQGIRASLAAE
jgi:nucleoside-diphosphate-sugar epimerase